MNKSMSQRKRSCQDGSASFLNVIASASSQFCGLSGGTGAGGRQGRDDSKSGPSPTHRKQHPTQL